MGDALWVAALRECLDLKAEITSAAPKAKRLDQRADQARDQASRVAHAQYLRAERLAASEKVLDLILKRDNIPAEAVARWIEEIEQERSRDLAPAKA